MRIGGFTATHSAGEKKLRQTCAMCGAAVSPAQRQCPTCGEIVDGPAPSPSPSEAAANERLRRIGKWFLLLYNLVLLNDLAICSTLAVLQIRSGRATDHLPLPQPIEDIYVVLSMTIHIASIFTNGLLLCWTIRRRAATHAAESVFYRLWLVLLAFVPVWGLRHFSRLIPRSDDTLGEG